jgi:chromosome segregation ATPase
VDRLRFEYETKKVEVDRLRFEYEKHQRSIQALQTKIAKLSRVREDLWNLDERMSASDNYTADAWKSAMSISDEMDSYEMDISTAEREMEKIHQALDKAEREMKEIHQALYEKDR